MSFFNGWNILLSSLADNFILMVVLVVFVGKVYFVFFKNQIDSMFDPLFLSIVYSFMASSVCMYMYLQDMFFKKEMFIAFILTELAYLIAIKIFWKKNLFKGTNILLSDSLLFENILYYIYGIIFMTIQIVSVLKLGLPVFSGASRLEFYRGGSGFFAVANASIIFPLLMLIFKRYFCEYKNCFDKIFMCIVFLFILIFLLGSGSKGAVLSIVYSLFFIKKFYEKKDLKIVKRINLLLKLAMGFAFFGMFFTMIIEFANSNFAFLFLSFIIRLVGSGDIFAYYYADDFYSTIIVEDSIFYAIFGSCFAMLRLIPYEELAPTIGLQIWQTVNSSFEIRGPNPRHNIFGVLYLGVVGGIFYSFLLGMISSLGRSVWLSLKNKSDFLFYIFLSYMYTTVIKLNTDIALGVGGAFQFILINVIVICIAFFIYKAVKRKI